jgi:hypothetical protein
MTIGKIPTSHPFFRSLDLITNKKVVDDLTKRHDISFSSHSVYQWNFLRYIIMFLGLLVLVEKETRERKRQERKSAERAYFFCLELKRKRRERLIWCGTHAFLFLRPTAKKSDERDFRILLCSYIAPSLFTFASIY